MANEGMIVEFKGDVSDLQKAANQAATSLGKVDKSAQQASKSLANVSSVSGKVSSAATQMARTSGALGGSLDKVGTAANKSATNFTGFSRVIQDLPFGLIGIQNNLTQILPAAGALGLGVSALVSAFTFASIGLQNWSGLFPKANDLIEEQANKLAETRTALKNYVDLLGDAAKIQLQGNQNSQSELINLKVLYEATQNQNISLANRKKIVDELQDQYPKYFGNIKDEIILAGGATTAYNKLKDAILASAKAKAGKDILEEINKNIFTKEKQLSDKAIEQIKLQQQLNALKSSGNKETTLSLSGEERLTTSGVEILKLQESIKNVVGETRDIQKDLVSLQGRSKNVLNTITEIVVKNPNAITDPTGELTKTPTIKITPKVLIEPQRYLFDETLIAKDDFEFNIMFRKAFENIVIKPRNFPKIIAPPFDPKIVDDFIDKEKLKAALNIQIESVLESGIGNFGESFGAAIAAGASPLEAAGKSIVNTIGDLISNIGKALVKYGIVKSGLDKVIKAGFSLPGVAAIAIGISAIAIGSLLKNAFNKPKGFRTGGIVPPGFPNDTFPAFLTSGERIVPAGRSAGIAAATGGNGSLSVGGEFRIRGTDLVVILEQANKSNRRDR